MVEHPKLQFLHENSVKLTKCDAEQNTGAFDQHSYELSVFTAVEDQPSLQVLPMVTRRIQRHPEANRAIYCSIFVMLFCCCPLGLAALLSASGFTWTWIRHFTSFYSSNICYYWMYRCSQSKGHLRPGWRRAKVEVVCLHERTRVSVRSGSDVHGSSRYVHARKVPQGLVGWTSVKFESFSAC